MSGLYTSFDVATPWNSLACAVILFGWVQQILTQTLTNNGKYWEILTNTDSNTDSEVNSNKNLMMRRAGLSTFAWKQQDDKSSILPLLDSTPSPRTSMRKVHFGGVLKIDNKCQVLYLEGNLCSRDLEGRAISYFLCISRKAGQHCCLGARIHFGWSLLHRSCCGATGALRMRENTRKIFIFKVISIFTTYPAGQTELSPLANLSSAKLNWLQ